MLYHMDLAPSVERALIVGSSAEYLRTTLAFLRDAEGWGQRVEAASSTAEPAATLAPPAPAATPVSLLQARAEVCAKSHILFSNNDTLRDWNAFLAHAVRLHGD